MAELNFTEHALQRMAQRGFLCSEIDMILAIGTEVPDGYLVTRKDCEQAEKALRQLLAKIIRLKNKRIVVADGSLITAYHASPGKRRKLIRSALQ